MGLTIHGATARGERVKVRSVPASEEVVLGPLPAGTREVVLSFEGKVSSDALAGFYRSRNGPDRTFLTTHLAPTGARRVFPCIDHPAAKAVFELTISAPADQDVIFNTEPQEVRTRGGRKTWHFQPTPKMSTYLFYLGVGQFDTLTRRRGKLRVSIRSPKGMRSSSSWALENAFRSVGAYSTYYGLHYPLPKLDLIDVEDFAAGAMENWGAITFREPYLLSDRGTPTLLRQIIAEVIAHEIAHQWFGNLVTMEWWNDIWLNESFATLMSYKMVDRFYPKWGVLGAFRVMQTGPALQADSLESTHPIDVPVKSPEEIGQIFDDISYGKGASVLRMLEAFLGEEKFRRGVAAYLKKHAYGTSKGEDLWKALERSSGMPVRRIVHPWVLRPGHPVVRVEQDGAKLQLRQQRFRLSGKFGSEVWPIPMIYRFGKATTRRLFDRPAMTIARPPGDLPFTLNEGALGFYRVLFDAPTYEALRPHLQDLRSSERWSILRDLYSFLLSGNVTPALYRSYLATFETETSPVVVQEASNQAMALYSLCGREGSLAEVIRSFFTAQGERLGLRARRGEHPGNGIVREAVTSARAFVDPDFAHEVAPRFGTWGELEADVRGGVAVAYARSEGPSAFEPLVARAREAHNQTEVDQLLAGLVAFRDPELVRRSLEWAVSGEVTRGVMTSVGVSASRNPDARPVVWPWFWQNVASFEKVYGGTAMLTLMVERFLPNAGLGRQAEVRRELQERPIAEAERGVRKGLELLALREDLKSRLL